MLHQRRIVVLRNNLRRPLSSSSVAASLSRFDPSLPVERASTPPSSWYTSRAFHKAEAGAVFGRSWVYAGRAEEVEARGSYVAGCVAGEPFFVARSAETGELNAFKNACAHKGMPVLPEGAGSVPEGGTVQCPYHGWAYSSESGRLAKAPRVKGIKDFRAAGVRLHRVAARTAGPFLFVNLTPGGEPAETLEHAFGDAHERFEALGYSRLRHVRSVSYRVRSNWKVFVDNYLDGGYHVAVAHPALAGSLDLDAYRSELLRLSSLQSAPAAAAAAAGAAGAEADAEKRVAGEALYGHVFPNLMINRYGPWMDTNVVTPVSPGECLVRFDYYLEPALAGNEAFVADSLASSDRVQQEDIFLCEGVQGGLESSAYDRGRYAPSLEFPMHHFHRLLHERMAAAAAAAVPSE